MIKSISVIAMAGAITFVSCEPSSEEKAKALKQKEDSAVNAIIAIAGPNILHSEYDVNGKEMIVAADGSTYTPIGTLTHIPLSKTDKALKQKEDSIIKVIAAITGTNVLHSEYDVNGQEMIVAADGSTYTPIGTLAHILLPKPKK